MNEIVKFDLFLLANAEQRQTIGKFCDSENDNNRYPHFTDAGLVPENYFYCDEKTEKFQIATCPTANGIQMVFDSVVERCILPLPHSRKRRGSGKNINYFYVI